jgi:hypothetical protein
MPTPHSLPQQQPTAPQIPAKVSARLAENLQALNTPEVQAALTQMINDVISFAMGTLELSQFKTNTKTYQQAIYRLRTNCPTCNGWGHVNRGETCTRCSGRAWIWKGTPMPEPDPDTHVAELLRQFDEAFDQQEAIRLARNPDTGQWWDENVNPLTGSRD